MWLKVALFLNEFAIEIFHQLFIMRLLYVLMTYSIFKNKIKIFSQNLNDSKQNFIKNEFLFILKIHVVILL